MQVDMKFSANLGFLFKEESSDIIQQYQLAKSAGFSGVETPFWLNVPVEELVNTKDNLDLEQVLINSFPGDMAKGDLGLACVSGEKNKFLETLEITATYAKKLNCSKVHVLAGKIGCNSNEGDAEITYKQNIRQAAEYFEKEGLICLIEPINNRSVPGYYMNSFNKAEKILMEIGHPNLKIMLDFYHAQIIQGDLTYLYDKLLPFIGHIQVAQVPGRGAPGSKGEIDFDYLFNHIKMSGYDGWIGLEYATGKDTLSSLAWLKSMNLFP